MCRAGAAWATVGAPGVSVARCAPAWAPGGFKPPPVKSASSPEALALAAHLKKSGAQFYGAYWCRFCNQQRTAFGSEALATLPYVECAEDGYRADTKKCRQSGEVTGYPTWQIGGKYYGGMRDLDELAELSGFKAPAASVTAPAGVEQGGGAGGPVTIRGEGGCTLSTGGEDCV